MAANIGREGAARKNTKVNKNSVGDDGKIHLRVAVGDAWGNSQIDQYTAPYREDAHGRCGLGAEVRTIPGDDRNVEIIIDPKVSEAYNRQCKATSEMLRNAGNKNRKTQVGSGSNDERVVEELTTVGGLANS